MELSDATEKTPATPGIDPETFRAIFVVAEDIVVVVVVIVIAAVEVAVAVVAVVVVVVVTDRRLTLLC
jgi:Flp pilus assembly protein TadB